MPKYVVIERDLVRRIGRAEFRAGEPLPSQRTLSEEYGVSLMTLRQALNALEKQGLIEQVPGKGTFVKLHRVPSYAATGLDSIVGDLKRQGIVMTTTLLRTELVAAPPEVAARLGANERVLEVERLRLVEGQPVVHQVSRLPSALGEALLDADFAVESLYGLLSERCGAVAARATETLSPVAISPEMRALLQVPAGALGLRSSRLTVDAYDAPLVLDDALLVSDRMEVTIEREASGQTFRFLSREG